MWSVHTSLASLCSCVIYVCRFVCTGTTWQFAIKASTVNQCNQYVLYVYFHCHVTIDCIHASLWRSYVSLDPSQDVTKLPVLHSLLLYWNPRELVVRNCSCVNCICQRVCGSFTTGLLCSSGGWDFLYSVYRELVLKPQGNRSQSF